MENITITEYALALEEEIIELKRAIGKIHDVSKTSMLNLRNGTVKNNKSTNKFKKTRA